MEFNIFLFIWYSIKQIDYAMHKIYNISAIEREGVDIYG